MAKQPCCTDHSTSQDECMDVMASIPGRREAGSQCCATPVDELVKAAWLIDFLT